MLAAIGVHSISPTEKLVLLVLASQANRKGETGPSREALALQTGLHVRSITRLLRSLQGFNHPVSGLGRPQYIRRIAVTPAGWTVYRLNLPPAPLRWSEEWGELVPLHDTDEPGGGAVSPGGVSREEP